MTVSDTDVTGMVAADDGAVPQPDGRSARASFHELTVAAVEQLTDDSAAVTFAVPPELRGAYDFKAGQSLTLRRFIDGEEHRRSYSICAPAGARPRVGVREIPDGLFSSWLVREVAVGDPVEVQTPTGSFRADPGRTTVVMTTHDSRLATYADRVMLLRDGRQIDDRPPPPPIELRDAEVSS